jgi:hypothetical protein
VSQAQFGLQGIRDFGDGVQTVSAKVGDYSLKLTAWNPNEGYVNNPATAKVRDNLYTLLFPLDTLGEQLDSEIMPLRVQWAAQEGRSELDPNSASWQQFKQLYSYQFGEQKTLGLYAPDLSFVGQTEQGQEEYNYGRYLRIVRLYVKPDHRAEFEDFVHKFIVPAATQIIMGKNEAKNLPPVDQRMRWRMPAYMRTVCMNVNMPTIPEFELFIQQHLLRAARDTQTPVMTYRTVTGDKRNYTMLFPFNDRSDMHYDGKSLMTSNLLKEHQLQLLAQRSGHGPKYQAAAFAGTTEERVALTTANNLASEFHSHALEIEEVVHRARPDMGSALNQRFTPKSIEFVQAAYRKS